MPSLQDLPKHRLRKGVEQRRQGLPRRVRPVPHQHQLPWLTVGLRRFDIGVPFNGASTPTLCKDRVGHQDDLPLLFRIPSSSARLTFVQQTAQLELFTRWSAFMRSGDPNASGYAAWPLVAGQAGQEKVFVFGGADGKSKGAVQTAPRKDECAVYTFA